MHALLERRYQRAMQQDLHVVLHDPDLKCTLSPMPWVNAHAPAFSHQPPLYAQRPSLLGLQRPPRPAAEVAAAAAARVRAWAAERCDEDVDALLLEAAQQVGALLGHSRV